MTGRFGDPVAVSRRADDVPAGHPNGIAHHGLRHVLTDRTSTARAPQDRVHTHQLSVGMSFWTLMSALCIRAPQCM